MACHAVLKSYPPASVFVVPEAWMSYFQHSNEQNIYIARSLHDILYVPFTIETIFSTKVLEIIKSECYGQLYINHN